MGSSDLDWRRVTLDVLTWVDIIVFSLTFIFACYNAYNFLIIQRRYNNFYLASFYFLAISVFGIRIVYYIHNLITWEYDEVAFALTWGPEVWVAVSAKVIIGTFQIG